jgi:hypothetical protein
MTRESKPQMASSFGYGSLVTDQASASEIFARNVQRLIDALGNGTQTGLERATRVPQRTISRALSMDNSPTLGTIEDLAIGCRFQPWQLLVPDFDPARPPTLTPTKVYSDRIRQLADALERATPQQLSVIEQVVAEFFVAQSPDSFRNDRTKRNTAEAG